MSMPRNVTVTIMILLFVVCGFSGKGEAGDYIGKFCWMNDGGETIELAVTHMGGQHYIVNGRITRIDMGGYVKPINGNAEIAGNIFRVQITSIGHVYPEVFGFFGVMDVDLTTLNATINGVGFGCNDGEQNCGLDNMEQGTLTYIQCP